jgi:hypothetical protein
MFTLSQFGMTLGAAKTMEKVALAKSRDKSIFMAVPKAI